MDVSGQSTNQGHADERAVDIAILTGGESRRMGKDKALLPWGTGTLLDNAIATSSRLAAGGNIYIIGDREDYAGRGGEVVADAYPGTGPLGGIATALRTASTARVLVVAVDMPCLSTALLGAMLRIESDADAILPVTDQPQPLHAIYRRRALPVIARQIDGGQLRIASIFEELVVTFLDRDWLRTYDPDERSFANANTPQDYRRLRQEHRS